MVDKDYKHLVGGIKRVPLTLSPSAANPLYGTKILNLKTQEIGLLICLWKNKFADKTVDCLGFLPRSQSFAFMPHGIVRSICSLSGRCRTEIRFATCVDKTGKRYNIELDNIRGFEDDFEK